MITFAQQNDVPALKMLWKDIFHDSDFFVRLFFEEKFSPHNTLIYRHNGRIVAALYMSEYIFRFFDVPLPCYYLSGLGTVPELRRCGIMTALIRHSGEVMRERGVPLSILIPATEKMYQFYEKFDYQQVFDYGTAPIALEKMLRFEDFDSFFSKKDFCIQKTRKDFRSIIADWEYDHRPPKTAVAGMAWTAQPEMLFSLFMKKTQQRFSLNLCAETTFFSLSSDTLTAGQRALCRLLFGYHTDELPEHISEIFPPRTPLLHLMLE